MTLQELAKQLSNEIEFLRGREKGDLAQLEGSIFTITNYDWKQTKEKGELKTFPSFIIKENDKLFFNGGTDFTKIFKEIDEQGLKAELIRDGLPVMIERIKTKDGNNFTKVSMYPLPF